MSDDSDSETERRKQMYQFNMEVNKWRQLKFKNFSDFISGYDASDHFRKKFKKHKPTVLTDADYLKLENVIFRSFMCKYGRTTYNQLSLYSIEQFTDTIEAKSKGRIIPMGEQNGCIFYNSNHLKDYAVYPIFSSFTAICGDDILIIHLDYDETDLQLILMIGEHKTLENKRPKSEEYEYLNKYTLMIQMPHDCVKTLCGNKMDVYYVNNPPVKFRPSYWGIDYFRLNDTLWDKKTKQVIRKSEKFESFDFFCKKFKKRKPTVLNECDYFYLENVIFRKFMHQYGQKARNHFKKFHSIHDFERVIKYKTFGIMKPMDNDTCYNSSHLKDRKCKYGLAKIFYDPLFICGDDILLIYLDHNFSTNHDLVLMIGKKHKLENVRPKTEYFEYLNNYTLITQVKHERKCKTDVCFQDLCGDSINLYYRFNHYPPVRFRKEDVDRSTRETYKFLKMYLEKCN